ncbi:hypothetical protein LIER_40888 [Lithospermum erythrorhizon]|uniref:Uncharacterized protein n=1 Tax=Lithospermum erythrorhizon TaxID=34254 RepID=A0AAV3R3A6_LITER
MVVCGRGKLGYLTGLRTELDEAKGRIISKEPFPSTEEAFAELRREDTRRRLMLQKHTPNTEQSAHSVTQQIEDKPE